VVEVDRDHSARSHHPGGRTIAHPGTPQQVLQMPDARLLLTLLLLCGVVAAVLPQVPLFAAGVDLRGDDRAVGDQLVELGSEAVVALLGEPDGRLAVGGHGQSPPLTAWSCTSCHKVCSVAKPPSYQPRYLPVWPAALHLTGDRALGGGQGVRHPRPPLPGRRVHAYPLAAPLGAGSVPGPHTAGRGLPLRDHDRELHYDL